MHTVNFNSLIKFARNTFLKMGSTEEEASLAADALVSADLRGVDSHGVARLTGYIRLWESGRINASPNIKIVYEKPATAVIDGDRGLGLVVAPKAMEIAIKKAEKTGASWVAVKNSNHFGVASYHSMMALKKEMIGISMTNASPLVSPTFSVERLLGTNPISVAIPAGEEPPFVADFATTPGANGKLEILQREDKPAPEGWLQKKDGSKSTNPFELKEGGALLPLGSDKERGSHKGYILGSLVDIFSGVLSGANYGPWVPPFVSFLPMPENPVGEGIGHFVGAMQIDAFRPAEEFKQHMDNWIKRFRKSKTARGFEKVLIPGDPERISEEKRKNEGIPIAGQVYKDLSEIAEKFHLDAV